MAAANPVPVDLGDGKTRALKLGIRALARVEREYGGKRIMRILLDEDVGCQFVLTFVWAGLLWQDPLLTIEQAGDLLDARIGAEGGSSPVLLELGGKIFEALMEANVLKRPSANGDARAADPQLGTVPAATPSPEQ